MLPANSSLMATEHRREQPGSGKETKAVPHASGTQGLLWCHATQDLSVQHPVNPPPFPWGDSSYSYGVRASRLLVSIQPGIPFQLHKESFIDEGDFNCVSRSHTDSCWVQAIYAIYTFPLVYNFLGTFLATGGLQNKET